MRNQTKPFKSLFIFLLISTIILEILLIIFVSFGKIEIYLFLMLGISNILVMVVSLLNIKKSIKH